MRYSRQKIQKANDGTRIKLYQQERFPKETWHDFNCCVKWSHTENGYVKGWLNGDQIIDSEGPIGYFDDEDPYFKFGLYHPPVSCRSSFVTMNIEEGGVIRTCDLQSDRRPIVSQIGE